MTSILALTIKKTIALFALVGPISMIPIFLAAVRDSDLREQTYFARTIGISVTLALLCAAFLGMPFLGILGVSLGAMQVGGGVIVLLLAIAMVLGKETSFKGSAPASGTVGRHGAHEASIVPLAVPLLAGPAAYSYVMGSSSWTGYMDLVHILVPILIVGTSCWLVFYMACRGGKTIRQSRLDLVERVSGFILAAMAVEMIATGLRGLFPILIPA